MREVQGFGFRMVLEDYPRGEKSNGKKNGNRLHIGVHRNLGFLKVGDPFWKSPCNNSWSIILYWGLYLESKTYGNPICPERM